MQTEREIQRQLRERLGPGARYDAPSAPAAALLSARRGTAVFARTLNELSDEELNGFSLLPSLSRRHVVAQVSFQARRLARIVEAARRGWPAETIAEPDLFLEDIDLAVTLPAHALRHLFKHSEVHLHVEWRDLADEGWERSVEALDGEVVRIRDTPSLRAESIWTATRDMDVGPRPHLPREALAARRPELS